MQFSLSDGIKEWVDRNKEGIADYSVDPVEMDKYEVELCKERIDQLKGPIGQAADPQLLRDCKVWAVRVLYYHALYSTTDDAASKAKFLERYDYWNTKLNKTITEYRPIFKTLEKARAGVGSSSSDGELGHALNFGIDDVAANHDYPHGPLLHNISRNFLTRAPIKIGKGLGERLLDPSLIARIGHHYTFSPDKMKNLFEDGWMQIPGRHGKMPSKNVPDYRREHGATSAAYYSDGGPGHGPNHVSPVMIIELKKLELGESAADTNVGPTEALGHDPNYTTEGFMDNTNANNIIEGAHANLGTSGVPIALPLTTEFQENTTNEYGGSNVPDQATIVIDIPTNDDDINATPAEPERVGNYLMTSQTNVLLGISAPFVALTNKISDSNISPHAMTLLVIAAALGVLFNVLGSILRGKRPTWSIWMTDAGVIINATAIIFSTLLHVGLVTALIGGLLAFLILAGAMFVDLIF